MMKKLIFIMVVIGLMTPALVGAQDVPEGTLSLATNPQVMVYIDGQRVGMTPVLNQRLAAGDHRVSLLLVRPGGERLRADYRVVIEADRPTIASLDLVEDAPAAGDVRTLAPEPPAVTARPAAPAQPEPPAAVPAAQPPRTLPPVEVAVIDRPQPATAVVATPQPLVDGSRQTAALPAQGLSREMVREGMEALRPVVERCMAGSAGIVQVRVTIQPDGSVADVEAQGIYHETEIGECIQNGFPEEAAFPIYSGDPIPVVYPFRIAGQ
jgi:hypothetical protein